VSQHEQHLRAVLGLPLGRHQPQIGRIRHVQHPGEAERECLGFWLEHRSGESKELAALGHTCIPLVGNQCCRPPCSETTLPLVLPLLVPCRVEEGFQIA